MNNVLRFREDLILFNPVMSPAIKEFSIAKLVTNGIVSQFLGNLVTLDSWNDAWIFKGLAKFLEYHFTGANELFISEVLHPTLQQQLFTAEFPFSVDAALSNEAVEKGEKLLLSLKRKLSMSLADVETFPHRNFYFQLLALFG